MKKRKFFLALFRHILTFIGGTIVATDADPELINEAIGTMVAGVGAVLSIIDKAKSDED